MISCCLQAEVQQVIKHLPKTLEKIKLIWLVLPNQLTIISKLLQNLMFTTVGSRRNSKNESIPKQNITKSGTILRTTSSTGTQIKELLQSPTCKYYATSSEVYFYHTHIIVAKHRKFYAAVGCLFLALSEAAISYTNV